MNITHIGKVAEGQYTISSLPCPKCEDILTLEIAGARLFRFHQGGSISEVLPDEPLATRERFITGYCEPCWDELFPDEDEEDKE